MPYLTRSDLIKRFGNDTLEQLTDRDDRGSIDSAVLDAAIVDASNSCDSYLQQAYTLPLTQTMIDASPLKRHCGDVVMFYLFSDGAPEYVEKNHDKAIKWLRDVAEGKATLGEQDTQAASSGRIVSGQGVSGTDWGTY